MALEQKLPGVTATGSERETLVAGVALFSMDAAKLAAFHAKVLQVAFEHRVHDDGREHHIADLGGVKFEVKSLVTAGGERTSDAGATQGTTEVSRSELSFRVADVAGASARALVSGARIVQKATTYDWGTFAVIQDPDGNRIGLWSPPRAEDNSDLEASA